MAGMEDIVGKTGNYHVRDKFKRFDNKFIRPLILKHVQVCVNAKKIMWMSTITSQIAEQREKVL